MAPGKKKRKPLQNVVSSSFPILLQLFQALLSMQTKEAAEMMLLISKIFWSSIHVSTFCFSTQIHMLQYDIPSYLQIQEHFFPWMNALLQLLNCSVPEEGLPADPKERKDWPWWKCKKWVAQTFTRLFQVLSTFDPVYLTEIW